jgi:flagellar hook-associated protein 1 FlgK
MSIGGILNIAQSAISASQAAIQVVSNNVANVDTPGYSEEEAVLTEAMPTPSLVGLLGNGVTVQQVKSYLDQNLQNAITKQNGCVQEQQVYEQNLTQIQSVFNESNSQLSTNMTTFFNDWSALSADSTNTADKQTIASDGQTLCSTFNTMYNDLVNLQSDLNGSVDTQIDDINGVTAQIASLNQLIAQGQAGTSQADEYIDQRNQLLQQLSGYMNINYFTDSNNVVDVLTSQGTSLVDGIKSYQLTKEQDPTTGMNSVGWQGPSAGVQDITGQIQGGSLGAMLTTRDSTIPGYLNNLNGLAQSIVQNVNYFHEQGNDDAGIPFFQSGSADCAQNIGLATQIQSGSGPAQTQNIMASSSTLDATDNDVADAIASLQNATLLGGSRITSVASSSETDPLGLSGTLAINGVAVTVGVGDSLSAIEENINAVAQQTGVTASVTSSSSGYQLVLAAADSGGNISVVDGDLDTSSQSLLQALTTAPVSGTGTAMNMSGTINLGQGVSVTVSPTDTLTSVETSINNQSGATGVYATISTSNGSSVLVLSTDAAGADPISIPSGTVTGTIGLAGATYADYEAGVVADVGQATESATDLQEYNQNALTSLQQQQSQESGVSVDDEMSSLIQYQNAYQAAARIFTVAQDMVDTLLTSVGVTTT